MTNDFKDKSNSRVSVTGKLLSFLIPMTVASIVGIETIDVIQTMTATTAEVGTETANAVVNLVPVMILVFVAVVVSSVLVGATEHEDVDYDLHSPNTLQDDIEEARRRYMDDEITEFRLEAEIGAAIEKHDEASPPSRLDEELMHERIDEETADLLMKMEDA